MSVKEAEKVNNSFKQLKDSVFIYRESLFGLEREFSAYTGRSIQMVGEHLKDKKVYLSQRDSIYNLYLANKKVYEHREKDFRKERQAQQLLTLMLGIITVVLAYK